MRAFYRIKKADWPLTREGEEWRPDCVEVGAAGAFVILHSGIYPNPALEALSGSKFLGNTYVELKANSAATIGQRKAVFRAEDTVIEMVDGKSTPVVVGRKMSKAPEGGSVPRREWIVPHSFGGRESVQEQADVDATL